MRSKVLKWCLPVLTMASVATVGLIGAGQATAAAKSLRVCQSGCPYTKIAEAVASARDGDTITVAAGNYDGPVQIWKNIKLVGAGAGQTTINPYPGNLAVIQVSATISGVTISGGAGTGGGGIFNYGTLTLNQSTVSGNNASQGGGISNGGTLTLNESTVSGNSASWQGGGIFNYGLLTLNDSTVSGNSSPDGPGIYNLLGGPRVILNDSTVDDCSGC
jgi:hypothetical protein